MRGLMDMVERVVNNDVTVLLRGETGTGKELIATLVHAASRRSDKPLARLAARVAPRRAALLSHPVYARLGEPARLQAFMRSHVFAVWDFMSLLKALQRQLTSVEVPWRPSASASAARLVHDIVLAEETDEIRPGVFTSHFELYLEAMREVGADRAPIDDFLAELAWGVAPSTALASLPIPEATKSFVLTTLGQAAGPPHTIAAAFFFGREALVPEMFVRVIDCIGPSRSAFRLYLERHVALDADEHAPKAGALLGHLCGNDRERWNQAETAAIAALEARQSLWDGVLASLP